MAGRRGDGDHRAAENRAGGKGGAQNKGRRNRPAPFALPFREGSPYFVCVSPTPLSDGAISPLSSIALAFSSPCRSEEHTSELQSLMRISSAVFCLQKKTHAPKQQPQ